MTDFDAITRYCEEHSSQPDGQLHRLYRRIWLETAVPHQSSSPYQGLFLEMLTRAKRPRLAVEVGAFMGYSTVCIARGLADGGMLHTIEGNEEYIQPIEENLTTCGMRNRVTIHNGDAHSLLPTMPDGIELAFVDADKQSYRQYYELLLPKMAQGGLLLLDNMLWYGNVIEPDSHEATAIDGLSRSLAADQRIRCTLLPLRDGIMICEKL